MFFFSFGIWTALGQGKRILNIGFIDFEAIIDEYAVCNNGKALKSSSRADGIKIPFFNGGIALVPLGIN